MSSELTAMPSSFNAGESVTYRRSVSDYPAPTWTLTLYLVGETGTSKAATQDGADHIVTLTGTNTANLKPGHYRWFERVTNGTQTLDTGSGHVVIGLNPALAAVTDGRAWDEQCLVAVRAAIKASLESGVQQFSLFGRAVQKYSLAELREMESDLVGRVADRKAAASGGNPSIGRPVLATFNKAGFDQ